MQVLTIDDSPTMRKIIRESLGKAGYSDVIEAEDCEVGLQKLRATAVDLILVDWNMPGMSGIDFVKTIRKTPALAGIPVIMVTSNADKKQVLSAVMAGVNDYLAKPFAFDVFSEKVRKALKM